MDVRALEHPVRLPPVQRLAQCLGPGFYTTPPSSLPTSSTVWKNLASYHPRWQLCGLPCAWHGRLMLRLSHPKLLQLLHRFSYAHRRARSPNCKFYTS